MFIQGVNLSEARAIPATVSQANDSQKHYCAVDDFCGTLSLLAETDESDGENKSILKSNRVDALMGQAGFLSGLILFFFPHEKQNPVFVGHSTIFTLQGISFMQAYCRFLI